MNKSLNVLKVYNFKYELKFNTKIIKTGDAIYLPTIN